MKPWQIIGAGLLLVGSAWAQSADLKKAHKTFGAAGAAYGRGEAALKKGNADKATAAFGKSTRLLRDAQTLLRREMYRYRYYEALSLKSQDRMADAWPLLLELAAQTDEPKVAADAKGEIDAFMGRLTEAEHGSLRVECPAGEIVVKVVAAGGSPAADREIELLGRWMPCARWHEPLPLPPGNYRVHLRRSRDDALDAETALAIDLGVGDRESVPAHFAMAPAPDVYVSVQGGCGPAGFQRVARQQP